MLRHFVERLMAVEVRSLRYCHTLRYGAVCATLYASVCVCVCVCVCVLEKVMISVTMKAANLSVS